MFQEKSLKFSSSKKNYKIVNMHNRDGWAGLVARELTSSYRFKENHDFFGIIQFYYSTYYILTVVIFVLPALELICILVGVSLGDFFSAPIFLGFENMKKLPGPDPQSALDA